MAQKEGAALACESKNRSESAQIRELSPLAGRQLFWQGSGLPRSTPTASFSQGPGRTLRSPLSYGVTCGVPSPALCTSICSSQTARTGQLDICLWEGDLMPVHGEAVFALTESIGWFGCDGERYSARLAVNSTAAFSAHSYCQDSNYSCSYFPIELI